VSAIEDVCNYHITVINYKGCLDFVEICLFYIKAISDSDND